ncbi:TonB-dependent receptor [soil metagenome]
MKSFFVSLFLAFVVVGHAQTDSLALDSVAIHGFLEGAVINATRAGKEVPTTHTDVRREDIAPINLGQDLPVLLDQTPSLVSTSDAGAGVGYTSLRIRGSDQTRINVTLNGIPYNDAESQGVFWVNMPDLGSSVNSIQIQRGVGTSTNGSGAFGGTVNIQTMDPSKIAFGEVGASYGSFNTYRLLGQFGTGLIGNRFAVQGRLSKIASDGYIDRASSDLTSFFISGAYYGEKDILRLNVLGGKEVTYQAWNGVDEATLATDRTNNSAGTDGFKKDGDPYKNEVDNYRQDQYQLIYSRQIGDKWYLNPALHYTRGYGYFEQYKVDENLADYLLSPVTIGTDSVFSTDLVRRRWLDNHFYGAVFSAIYKGEKLGLTFGGGWNQYRGQHYGEVIWAEFATGSNDHRYYESHSTKNDGNVYAKLTYTVKEKLRFFIDLQYRNVMHQLDGTDNDLRLIHLDKTFHFFNPKAGVSYDFSKRSSLYTTFAVGNREPTRSDFIDAPVGKEPKAERLYNLEVGYQFAATKYSFGANYYLMSYKDQLVLTGELNDVGSAIRTNVEKSYRMGIELMGAIKPLKWLRLDANLTYSINKIKNFEEVLYVYDDDYNFLGEQRNLYENTDISFSPSLIAAANLTFTPVKGLNISLLNKYVGKQYLDNTQNEARKLNGYYIANLNVGYTFKFWVLKEVTLSVLVNNLFNHLYESNGYTFSEVYRSGGADSRGDYNYYYPQAGINVLGGIKVRF